jgi:hypothetical protein
MLVESVRHETSWTGVFLVISTLFFASAILLLLLGDKPVRVTSGEREAVSARFIARRLLEGYRFISDDLLLRNLFILGSLPLILTGAVQVLVPAIGVDLLHLPAQERALLISGFGFGLILGGVGAIGIIRTPGIAPITIGCYALLWIATGSLQMFGAGGGVGFGTVLVFIGVIVGAYGNIIPTSIQGRTPDEVRGRVMSVYSLAFLVVPAIAGMVFGSLADVVGLKRDLACLTLTLFVLFVLILAGGHFRIGVTDEVVPT